MSKLNSDQAQNATANTWASCYPTRPPVPMHAALDSTHPSVHPHALTLIPLNAEKHASLPAAVRVPGSRSSGSGRQPPATRKMADIPCQWQTRLSPSLSLARVVALFHFPPSLLLPCSERGGGWGWGCSLEERRGA